MTKVSRPSDDRTTHALREDERARHRERLASLYATARSLTALGEVEEVLASIVRHAHELIGTDLTYLSVLSEDQSELTLRKSEGSISPAFRKARVPASTGIGGQVIRHTAPFWVSNYLKSPQLAHNTEFDRLVEGEGLIALLGVPLRSARGVTGVLYAADRVERAFSPDEVALLSAFADHASVALENARLYEESRSALKRLRDAYEIIEAQVAETEHGAQVHEELTKVVLAGGGLADVAPILGRAIGGRVAILNRDDLPLVDLSGSDGVNATTTLDLHEILNESRRSGHAVSMATGIGSRHSVVAVLAGESYLGAVVLSHDQELSAGERRTLERAAQIVGLLDLNQHAVAEAEARVRGDLLAAILSRTPPVGPELVAVGVARHLDLRSFDTILVAQCDNTRTRDITRALHSLSSEYSGLAGEYLGVPTLLLGTNNRQTTADTIQRRLRKRLSAPTLVCTSALDLTAGDPSSAFMLALRCCRLLAQLGISDRAATTEQFGLYAILFDPDRKYDLYSFIHESLGPLITYDERRRTDLLSTMAAYFEYSGKLTQTAKAIHVHVNTLLKRLDRIGSILGSDWRKPDTALRLHFAVRLYQLANQ